MTKFEVGDTVVGNVSNAHGVTCEDCVLVVTATSSNTFSGIIQDHPFNDEYVGRVFDNLTYSAFDYLDDEEECESKVCAPARRFSTNSYVKVLPGKHIEAITCNYEGDKVKVITDMSYQDDGWHYLVAVGDDVIVIEVSESEITLWAEGTPPAKAWGRVSERIVVEPAHRSDSMPIKSESIRTPTFDRVLDLNATKKKGHVPLKTDY